MRRKSLILSPGKISTGLSYSTPIKDSSVSFQNKESESVEAKEKFSFDLEEIRLECESRKQRYSERDKEIEEILNNDIVSTCQTCEKKEGLETLQSMPSQRVSREITGDEGYLSFCCKKLCVIS